MKHSDKIALSSMETKRASCLTHRKALLLAVAFVSLTSIGHGQVLLLNDQFNRTGGLDNSTPTFSATPETWTASSGITTDGTEAAVPTPPGSQDGLVGYIGIPGITGPDLAIGSTYTLSFTLTQPAPSGDNAFLAAGFGTDTNVDGPPHLEGNDASFFAFYNSTGSVAITDEIGGVTHVLATKATTGNADIVLTLQVGATSDTLSAIVNGSTVLSSFSTAAPVDPISQLFVGNAIAPSQSITGNVQNLVLDGPAVPEPRTWAMLLGGFGVLLFVGRLRRKLSL